MSTRTHGKTDVLVFVEDPGAVNGLEPLVALLRARDRSVRLWAVGHAAAILTEAGVEHDDGGTMTAARMIDKTAPRVVVAGTAENRDTLGLALIAEARAKGIPNAAFVDAPVSADYRFRGRGDDPLAFAPDRVLCADGPTADAYRGLGLAAERVVEVGHPLYDRVLDQGRELTGVGRSALRAAHFPGAAADRPVVLFLAEISAGLTPSGFERGPDYTLTGRGGSEGRTEIVLEEVLDTMAAIKPRPYFVLRLHPKNTEAEFAAYASEIDRISTGGPPWPVVFAADLVIGMTTTLLLEAALLGRPTLSVTPRAIESAWQAATALGITPAVHERDALRRLLAAALADPAALKGAAPESVLNFGAAERMADALSALTKDQG